MGNNTILRDFITISIHLTDKNYSNCVIFKSPEKDIILIAINTIEETP
jgi:hypothetical protein